MSVKNITPAEKELYNSVVQHPLQSYEWGEFRKKTNVRVIRRGFFEKDMLVSAFQLTLHNIPQTNYTIGYLPKGDEPTKAMIEELTKIGKENNCVYIQLEPNLIQGSEFKIQNSKLRPSFHPLFTKFTFMLDVTKSEDELLKNMHPKTRYNIKVAQKHGVQIVEDNSEAAFEQYWQIMEDTTKRQKFYAHTKRYHQLQFETFGANSQGQSTTDDELQYHLLLANYTPVANDQGPMTKTRTLAAWVLFTFRDTLYYPYGSSSSEHRETMASNLMMWEAIRFGKKWGLKKFDMWGALSENPDTKDPWYGFHKFKQGYGSELVEFVGSYDLVINETLYQGLKIADKLRWFYLKMKK